MNATAPAISVVESARPGLRGATSFVGTAAVAPTVHVSALGDTLLVLVAGDVDLAVQPALDRAVLKIAAAAEGKTHVAVDLSHVSFLGSTGVSFVLCVLAEAVAAGASMTVDGSSPAAARVLRLAGVDALLHGRSADRLLHRPLVAA